MPSGRGASTPRLRPAVVEDLRQRLELGMGAGVRLSADAHIQGLLSRRGAIGRIAASLLDGARAVRLVLFDKTPETNWAVGWRQDRTIAVVERLDIDGFGPWSLKASTPHVEPTFDLSERMITLRVHLDDCAADNAPLRIAPGSHRLGRIGEGSGAHRRA